MHEQRYNEIARRGLRRRRRDHGLMALRLAAAGLCLALVGELVWALCCSPRFRVRQIRLVGADMLDPAAVAARAAIRPGAGLAGVPTRKIRRDIEGLSAVKSAAVRRDWPDAVVITVHERTPAAFVRRGAGIIYLDRQGVAFSGMRCNIAGLPELRGVNISLAPPGRAHKDRALAGALAALEAAQEPQLPVRVVEVRAHDDLLLRLADGTALHVGRPEQLELKFSQAKVALTQLLPLHKVEYIDVSCPDAAVWKPRVES